ncbi:Spore coat polysaccharide biosynthesis protein F CMP-KDO synthetase-like protein [Pirellula staleyi DSM 6068]|uniref:Spore coat polysaccharide biosynthesis protein F CMP-KDO synthetase-like protein n=1 Tax=Pirellula staleyi (strain ATCC 27377 / DSM 6068 / ICPB 4128) TaxID=530564 RepID=D2R6Q8_PIRSD|nr:NTP transferase domain-containing protein [Pirellula staleyi]ADB17358.1 Spore coat polysaccharide biosynthesis protein F CMP-KDO synthetase-like protein [Pirellula staleyi DSM 6068]
MYKTLGVVEALPSLVDGQSSLLRSIGKRRFAGKSLLEWIVRHATESHFLDRVVVLAGNDPVARSLAEVAPPDVTVYGCSAGDPLSRLAATATRFPAESIVRLSVSQPFVDADLIDRLISTAESDPATDYVSFAHADGRPAITTGTGVAAEWINVTALLEADRDADQPLDRQHPSRYLYRHPGHFHVRMLPLPKLLDRDDLRLAIQDELDWEFVQMLIDALGPDSLDWRVVASLLDRHPSLCQQMAARNFELAMQE